MINGMTKAEYVKFIRLKKIANAAQGPKEISAVQTLVWNWIASGRSAPIRSRRRAMANAIRHAYSHIRHTRGADHAND
jgi:hypothetical protein